MRKLQCEQNAFSCFFASYYNSDEKSSTKYIEQVKEFVKFPTVNSTARNEMQPKKCIIFIRFYLKSVKTIRICDEKCSLVNVVNE